MTTGLTGIRVLECATGIAGASAGRMLAMYGADVVKVEPPEGDPARRADLLGGGEPDPEASPLFLFLHAGKRSVVLDATTGAGSRELQGLVAAADVVLEDVGATELSRLGLDWGALHLKHPGLIVTSLSPFGSLGPYAHYLATDFTLYAIGGQMHFTGDPEGTPMKLYGFQAEYQLGLHGFSSTLLALVDRARNGRAQHVEVAGYEVEAAQQEEAGPSATIHEVETRIRVGNALGPLWGLYPAKDGYVGLYAIAPNIPAMARALEYPRLIEDAEMLARVAGADPAVVDELEAVVRGWCLDRTKEEVFQAGAQAGAPMTMVMDLPDVLRWPWLVETGFWRAVNHPKAGRAIHPGPSLTLGEGAGEVRPAPLLGEHNAAVRREWSSAPALSCPAPSVVRAAPLENVRVLDFTIVWSGPYAAALLADMGAEVIKVEGPGAVDVVRPIGIVTEAERDHLYAPYVAAYNRNKLGIGIDLKARGGRELLLELAARCDVVMENFRAGVLERLGLGYEDLRRVNPNIILLQMPGFASTGPDSVRAAYGPVVEAMSGFVGLGGLEGEGPLFSGISYSDPLAGTFAAGAVLLALLHRERTGRGQRLELSQRDNMIGLLGEAFVLHSLTGKAPPRLGNRHPTWVQGLYACRPLPPDEAVPYFFDPTIRLTERWLALTIRTDEEWRAAASLIESDLARDPGSLARDAKFATCAERRRRHDEIDTLISEWASTRDVMDLFHRLQAAGVPAAPLYHAVDQVRDAHLRETGYLEEVVHPVMGRRRLTRPLWHLSETPQHLRRAAPLVGEDNDLVLRDVLGLDPAAIAALRARGVVAERATRE